MRIALRRFLIAVCALAIAPLAPADGQTYAIKAGRIITAAADAPFVVEDGVILVRDGRIAAVGRDVEIPDGVPVLDLSSSTIMPGLVSASSNMAGQHSGDHSISASFRAADTFNGYDDHRRLLASGITTMHLNPGWNRLISGQGAVVRLAGEQLLVDSSDLTINLHRGADNPPALTNELVPPSPDNAVTPDVPQRPGSRMSRLLALQEAITIAASGDGAYSANHQALRRALDYGTPWRIHVENDADLASAVEWLRSQDLRGYVVGATGASAIAAALADSDVPIVYTLDEPIRPNAGAPAAAPVQQGGRGRRGGRGRGFVAPAPTPVQTSDEKSPGLAALAAMGDRPFALGTAQDLPPADLRRAASLAQRAGLSDEQVINAVTRIPAEILGVGDRVGSIAPGRDADLLVIDGDPLAPTTHIERVLVQGREVYNANDAYANARPTVISGGVIWMGPNDWLYNGAILIENGKIADVGYHVARPPGARVIDASGSFITPGLIDAHGHLGLDGDRSASAPQVSLSRLLGSPGEDDQRVAGAGVTTVMLAPYSFNGNGSQISAIKTAGGLRDDRTIEATAAVALDYSNSDPRTIANALNGRIKAGRDYQAKWDKYEEDLAAWEKQKAEGTLDEDAQPEIVEVTTEQSREDPITGTWEVTITGGPIPEPVTGKVALRLTGNRFEGRLIEPQPPAEVDPRIVGTVSGGTVSGRIQVETGGMGEPTFSGDLTTDSITGTISVGDMLTVEFEASRIDKEAVEFSVTSRRRVRGEGGKPLPPKVDEALEPLRAFTDGDIPALVRVSTPQQLDAVLDVFETEAGLSFVLIDAPRIDIHAERVRDRASGFVLPVNHVQQRDGVAYHQGVDLARRRIPIAIQSDAEEGARSLRRTTLYSIHQGLGAEDALAALTINAAAMYGIDDRVGSIAPGRDADLVIFSDHPFDASSRVLKVIINGREVKQ